MRCALLAACLSTIRITMIIGRTRIRLRQLSYVFFVMIMQTLLNKEIEVVDFRNLQRVVFTGSKVLIEIIEQIPKTNFPFITTIIEENERYEFT